MPTDKKKTGKQAVDKAEGGENRDTGNADSLGKKAADKSDQKDNKDNPKSKPKGKKWTSLGLGF